MLNTACHMFFWKVPNSYTKTMHNRKKLYKQFETRVQYSTFSLFVNHFCPLLYDLIFCYVLMVFVIFIVIWSNSTEASEINDTYHITCPETWPGPEHPGEKLTWVTSWSDPKYEYTPDPHEIEYTGLTMLECAYGKNEFFSSHRITVVIPGHVKNCHSPWIDRCPQWCDTVREPGKTLGPIKLYIAHPLDWTTNLLGFGLRRSMTDVLATAKTNGFTCTKSSEESDESILNCHRKQDEVRLAFNHKVSYEVRLGISSDEDNYSSLLEKLILQFGLRRTDETNEYFHHSDAWLDDYRPRIFPRIMLILRHGTLTLRDLTVDQ